MANNRIYLRCKACGEEFFLGKRFSDGYYISEYPDFYEKPFMDRMNDFYEKHNHRNEPDCFEISYEMEANRF